MCQALTNIYMHYLIKSSQQSRKGAAIIRASWVGIVPSNLPKPRAI